MAPVHAGMKRRHFLKALGTAAVALAAASLPTPTPTPQPAIARDFVADLSRMVEHEGRITMRLLREYNVGRSQHVNRFDVLYGWAAVKPSLEVRLVS